jgi:hypothetical protein
MGCTTKLYSIELKKLRAACGSKDAAIVEAVLAADAERNGGRKPVDWRKGPSIFVTWKSEILFNDELVTKEELPHRLLEPRWTGTKLYFYIEPPPKGEERQGEFRELVSFYGWLTSLGPFFIQHGTTFRDQFVGTCTQSEPRSTADIDIDAEEISDEDALRDLVNGKFTRKRCSAEYGYALERLCGVLGKRLDSVGTDRLRSLELKTKLSRIRTPVKLPRIADFPYISYLEHDEVVKEYDQFKSIRDTGIDEEFDEERRRFVSCLKTATELKHGIVGFYY